MTRKVHRMIMNFWRDNTRVSRGRYYRTCCRALNIIIKLLSFKLLARWSHDCPSTTYRIVHNFGIHNSSMLTLWLEVLGLERELRCVRRENIVYFQFLFILSLIEWVNSLIYTIIFIPSWNSCTFKDLSRGISIFKSISLIKLFVNDNLVRHAFQFY